MTDSPSPANSLFDRKRSRRHGGIRVIVTGQVGLDKRPFLEQVVEIARENGRELELFNVGERMYAEAPDIAPGRILDLPKQRLTTLRRSVFKDVLAAAGRGPDLIVNTHATFRWKHGLFHSFDHHQMVELDADLYVTLIDNVDAVHERLRREHEIDHSLKDILVWREEETVVTETMAEALAGYGCTYIMSRSNPTIAAQSLYRLIFEPRCRRVYPSFPMTHAMDLPEILREIDRFRDALAEHLIIFDPADLDENRLIVEATEAIKRGDESFEVLTNGRPLRLNAAEVADLASAIAGQIYARDFKMIDQSDMIVSYIPTLPGGRPVLSSGVEREVQHAFESTKEVFAIWRPDCEPSPFVTETATAVFRSTDELLRYLQKRGDVGDFQLPLG